MEMIAKKKVVIIVVAIVIAILGYYLFFVQSEPKQEATNSLFTEMDQAQQEKESEKKEEGSEVPVVIKVDVKGAVRNPGVFIAKPGDRVIDLIASAGDFTKEADLNKVNLAQLVEDQMVIYVPRMGEEDVELPASASNGGAVAVSGSTEASDGTKVNLNTATQTELETLTGIGPAKAMAIIEYRETTGKFQQIEDLKNISGFGDKTFEKLQDSITVK